MKHLDLIQEIDAIRRMGEFAYDGQRYHHGTNAFGANLSTNPADRFYPHFLFSILPAEKPHMLDLVVDAYMATDPTAYTQGFDVDEWDAQKMIFQAPADRAGFQALSRIGRALLRGGAVSVRHQNRTWIGNLNGEIQP